MNQKCVCRPRLDTLLYYCPSQFSSETHVTSHEARLGCLPPPPPRDRPYTTSQPWQTKFVVEHLLMKATWLIGIVEPLSRGELSSSPPLNQQLTKFSHEVVDLLQHSPRCCLPFSRFIPMYHHHFGRQCRIATYGFTKLIELFDAVPHVAEVRVWIFIWYWHCNTVYYCCDSLAALCQLSRLRKSVIVP